MGRFLAFAALVAVILVGTLQVNAQVAGEDAKKSELEKAYLELAARRAKQLTEEELSTLIGSITKAIQEDEIERRLDAITKELKDIALKNEGTRGAQRAAMALKALGADGSWAHPIQPKHSPYSGAPTGGPIK